MTIIMKIILLKSKLKNIYQLFMNKMLHKKKPNQSLLSSYPLSTKTFFNIVNEIDLTRPIQSFQKRYYMFEATVKKQLRLMMIIELLKFISRKMYQKQVMDITMFILIQEEEPKVELHRLYAYGWKDEANYITTKKLFVLFYNKVKRELFIEGLNTSIIIYEPANTDQQLK